MTEQELKERLSILKEEYESKRNKIEKEYALENNPYKVGDIIEDNFHRIKIENINFYREYTGNLVCMYCGIELKKDNTPKIRQINNKMIQCNVKRKIS